MISDDQFNLERDRAIRQLTQMSDGMRDVAHVVIEQSDNIWRLGLEPHAPGACAFDLAIRADQRFDILIADQLYEDLPIETFELFVGLAHAITDGRVIVRRYFTPLTGTETGSRALVQFDNDVVWSGPMRGPMNSRHSETDFIAADSHFVPYRLRMGVGAEQ